MSVAIVIPARYGSERLKGKPMIEIAGVTLLERVWRIAKTASGGGRVVIATEDQRVADHAARFGAEAVLTPEKLPQRHRARRRRDRGRRDRR